jgi:hypothetical protein
LIKLIFKLAIVALLANATWRVGSAYLAHYKFEDGVQQATQFKGRKSDEALKQRVMELAAQYDIPVTDDQVRLQSQEHHTIVDGEYTREIELAPTFVYPWPFSFHIDTLSDIF